MNDAIKFISGLDVAVFAVVLIVFRYVFSRFTKIENRITELSEIKGQLKLIVYRLDELSRVFNSISVVQVKNQENVR